ncbi:MAG TPA: sugar transferase [Acidimicrobiales bacterium]|nr:sugar transferase [Acidimicrobiales bacterium]
MPGLEAPPGQVRTERRPPPLWSRRVPNRLLLSTDDDVRRWLQGQRSPMGDAVPERDELIVRDDLFDDLRKAEPRLLERTHRVWLLPADDVASRSRTPRLAGPLASPLPPVGRVMKRALDVLLALVGLLLALPVLVLAAVAVRVETPGPILFRQVRVGANGKRFQLLKIRTMVHRNDDGEHRSYVAAYIRGAAPAEGGVFKLVRDPRITRVGRLLRRFSVDELPQLWNVLMGDMSLIGPRPALPEEVGLYDRVAWQRLRVRPGLTGPWQVGGRCRLSFAEMVDLDVAYWCSWSFRRDIGILLRTPRVVLLGTGAA